MKKNDPRVNIFSYIFKNMRRKMNCSEGCYKQSTAEQEETEN